MIDSLGQTEAIEIEREAVLEARRALWEEFDEEPDEAKDLDLSGNDLQGWLFGLLLRAVGDPET